LIFWFFCIIDKRTRLLSRYEYNITDHLGNTRVTFTDKDGDGVIEIFENADSNEVLSESHYYPFGMQMEGSWMSNPGRSSKYRYNNKELNEDFGLDWYDYGARWYDASIGRWNAVDPLAEAYFGFSTYNYVLGNPISLVDPDGTSVSSTGGAITFTGEDAVNAFRQIQSNFNSSPPNEYTAVHKEDGTVEYRQISNEGGDNYDIIHHQYGQVPEKGSSVVTERIDNVNGGARLLPGLFTSYKSVPGTINATDSPLEWGLEGLPKMTVKGSLILFALISRFGDEAGEKILKQLPKQIHHLASNKNKVYTPQFKAIANKFGLDLGDNWNKVVVPHRGRHPNAYHNFVLSGMQRAAVEAGTSKEKFLNLFNSYVKEPVVNNPLILRKIGWE
jgi:RHS repeat-associated protein